MRETEVVSCRAHSSEIDALNKAIDGATTKIRRRKMPMSVDQQISVLTRVFRLVRRLGEEARPDVQRMAALVMGELSRRMDYQRDRGSK